MSIGVMSWVFEHSEATGSGRLVLLALADFAHDDGTRAFPSVESLAVKARMSKRSVQYALRKLEEDGMVEHTGETATSKTRIYSVLMGGANLAPSGVQAEDRGVQQLAPNPSEEPSALSEGITTSDGRVRAWTDGPVIKFAGKPVHPGAWEQACEVLGIFNEETGNEFDSLTSSTGEATEVVKRIYGRVRKWPELSTEQHRDIIDRTLSSKWWGDNEPSIGVIYGPKVFEENMIRKPDQRRMKDAGRRERATEGRAAIERLMRERG